MTKKHNKHGNDMPEDSPEKDVSAEKETDNGKADKEQTSAENVNSKDDKISKLNEKYLRLLAEHDNYRKRKEKEIDEIREIAAENLVTGFLPILDNLDRASEHKEKLSFEDYAKGVEIVEEQLRKFLARAGVEKVEVIGEVFDPEIHDAVMQMESKEYDSGIIIAEAEKGYSFKGKIIRHPKVIVSK